MLCGTWGRITQRRMRILVAVDVVYIDHVVCPRADQGTNDEGQIDPEQADHKIAWNNTGDSIGMLRDADASLARDE